VVLRGALGEVEPGGDLPVGQPLRHQLGDLALPPRQLLVRRPAVPVGQLLGSRRERRHAEGPGSAGSVGGQRTGPCRITRLGPADQRQGELD
jgi:hypothetical protein